RFFGPPPIGLTWASSSFGRFLRHTSLPASASTQTKSPTPPSANTRLPSTVGVALGPALQLLPFHSKRGPIRADQTSETPLSWTVPMSRAIKNSVSPRPPVV